MDNAIQSLMFKRKQEPAYKTGYNIPGIGLTPFSAIDPSITAGPAIKTPDYGTDVAGVIGTSNAGAASDKPASGDEAGPFGWGKQSQWAEALKIGDKVASDAELDRLYRENEDQRRASEAASRGTEMLNMIQAMGKRNQENNFRTSGLMALAGR